MNNYTIWSKHGEGVYRDEDEEEEDNDIPVLAEYYRAIADANDEDIPMGNDDQEGVAENEEPTDGLGQMLRDAEKRM